MCRCDEAWKTDTSSVRDSRSGNRLLQKMANNIGMRNVVVKWNSVGM